MKNERRHPELRLDEEAARQQLRKTTRRGLLAGGVAAAAAAGFYGFVTGAKQEDNAPWPERRVLEMNGKLSHAYLDDKRQMTPSLSGKIGGVKVNGDIGLGGAVDRNRWRMAVSAEGTPKAERASLADVLNLPRVEMTTRFCCIEGWSGTSEWAGARFSDFTRRFFGSDARLPNYAYLATPDEEYYVGLDMKSALHPQTLLAYEQNGKPLETGCGAPLRLVIPVKYGIKNLKRIGQIRYTDQKPDDYWADEGYDWFAGL